MSDRELAARLDAVERTLGDCDADLTELRDAAELTETTDRLDARLDRIEDRVDELEAAVQALRGYVGNVRSVNRDVERRADAALATAERVERRVTGEPGETSGEPVVGEDGATTSDEPLAGSSQSTPDRTPSGGESGLGTESGPGTGSSDGGGSDPATESDPRPEQDPERTERFVQRVRDVL